jgi:hypothetical protein
MLSPDDPDARHIVTDIVATIAAESGFTTLMRIGESPIGPFTINDTYLHDPDLDYGQLLRAVTVLERAEPLALPISACALLLPDRDIAYIQHGAAPMTTLTVGPNPVDDPGTHQAVQAGLDALMQVIGDTQPAARPTGRPFPPTAAGRMPHTSPLHGPINGWSPPPAGPDRSGHHR